MARVKIEVDKGWLTGLVHRVEANGPLANLNALYKAIEATPEAKEKGISFSVVALRVAEFGIVTKTQKGRKGRVAGMPVVRGPRVPKAEKFAASKTYLDSFAKIEASIPTDMKERFTPVLEAARNGSRSAGVKLKCLDCSHWSSAEIKHCTVTSCGLWPFRPYQEKAEEGDKLDSELTEVEVEEAAA
jgi:hypothetical protein